MADTRHKLLGEHVYDGMTLWFGYPPEILRRVKESFLLRDDDTLVVSYPRSGELCHALIFYQSYYHENS